MDNQDKLFDKFKEASHNAEAKDFPAMEKVWSRVEDKLDKKEDKKTISLWKKIAVAASLLLVISLGSQFLKSDKTTNIENPTVVTNEKSKDRVAKPALEQNDAIVSSSEIIPKAEATQILEKQLNREPVAVNEIRSDNSPVMSYEASPVVDQIAVPVQAAPEYEAEENNSSLKEKTASESHYFQAKKSASYELAKSESQAQMSRKSKPLVVLNGNAIAHSDDTKRDKMMQDELPNLKPENVESLVILEDPLYIIDGVYYSENDLFGNNPTSPYAPLDKQDIKTMTILQDLEATSKYGEKGKKGVVIITTKNGKPALKK
ncbi:hypothetical protein GON26_18860 [Flavobacterium sp. GA093]|uniref:TonB-dependent receptor plug domain-containing protein n=1 Tax=Flavobacterium hydrocarbonoxydans TaxID=2683249 RepID=A0A6I4NXF9_9FLAO|nr:hypothetical protein [Flavobacterium hydrocarbonoxydans]MWB96429.1 hypothetical protein [Flavobacterium hydrocarbonoxydans]